MCFLVEILGEIITDRLNVQEYPLYNFLVDNDPSRAVSMFWVAINAGDQVNSALKDMAVVMKQFDRMRQLRRSNLFFFFALMILRSLLTMFLSNFTK
ncbi:hypothetical protein Pint_31791 [Pistacia integerrima]|uniref:Uncharacterized protein n=1 Tax=Pistacia integerrima TaxID=434235 RepID=A0ACC0XQP9_9ROSI|nr:hypothetical protein Pint_31791 [Pistacia integerrima]